MLPRYSRLAMAGLIATLLAGCDPHLYPVLTGSGPQMISFPPVPGPPGAPVCEMAGSSFTRSAPIGAEGGTLEGRPDFRRTGRIEVLPTPRAAAQPFNLIELPSDYPQVGAQGPANRPVRLTLGAESCSADGPLTLYRYRGGAWVAVEGAAQESDGSVTAELPSIDARFGLGAAR